MAPFPSLDDVRGVFEEYGDVMDCPGAQEHVGQILGLDLPDRPGVRTGRWLRRRQIFIPESPTIPACPPVGEWEWWMPCWLELPMALQCPDDFWWYPSRVNDLGVVPECWFRPVWNGGWRSGHVRPLDVRGEGEDPYAVLLLWRDADGHTRRPAAPNKKTT